MSEVADQFAGKVAVITGAGGGLGRCHALLLANYGCKIVVNDVGSNRHGEGDSQKLADSVVAEVEAAGSQAVANYASVATREGADSIIQSGLDAFGRVDFLINNAGILRDKTLLKLEETHWDQVIDVHLKGTFLVTQAFMQHVKTRSEAGDSGGRIVNTSSYAGLKGNFGQSNYSAAKAGIAGLTRTWALEFARFGVNVNAIAPVAKTRMTEDISMISDEMRAEQISPMVMFLCSDYANKVNGQIFGIHGQQIFEYQMHMTDGVTKQTSGLWTVPEIAQKFSAICAKATAPQAPAATAAPAAPSSESLIDLVFKHMPEVFLAKKAGDWNANIQFEIDGASNWSLIIESGTCETKQGLHGDATCTVEVDADIWADIVTGEMKAEQAFMTGKISATNLQDMVKLGTCFDMKKAAALLDQVQSAAPAQQTSTAPEATAAPAAPSSESLIDLVFKHMPEVFLAKKAGDWNANIQFEIDGASNWSLIIESGTCETKQGLHGEATCTVEVDADIWADIVTGEMKAEQAFMTGKISATNLQDMVKLGTCFDMKKASEKLTNLSAAPAKATQQPAKQAQPEPPAEKSPADLIKLAFSKLAEVFNPAAAKGWTANIQFHFSDSDSESDDWTIIVDNDACHAVQGREGESTCVVDTDMDTWQDVMTGEIRAEQAFMTGKVNASNLQDIMKLGLCFDLSKAASLLQGAEAESPDAEPASKLNREFVGRQFKNGHVIVKAAHTKAYAEATNDSNPAYFQQDGLIAPPMFPVRLLRDALFGVIMNPDLNCDMLKLLHGEQEMEFLSTISPGDLLVIRSSVDAIETKSSGELIHIGCRLYRDGEVVCKVRSSMFIRSSTKNKVKRPTKIRELPDLGTPAFTESKEVTEDQSLRYADASLDHNPIHTDVDVAKMAGHKNIILQGLCTMAFAAQAITNNAAKGDPARLKKISVRFSKPVYPGDTVTTKAWLDEYSSGQRSYRFSCVNQDGTEVISNGHAVVV